MRPIASLGFLPSPLHSAGRTPIVAFPESEKLTAGDLALTSQLGYHNGSLPTGMICYSAEVVVCFLLWPEKNYHAMVETAREYGTCLVDLPG